MKERIGFNAGIVWNVLCDGPQDVKALKKLTKLTDKDLFSALGWLAREEKVNFTETEKDVVVSLA